MSAVANIFDTNGDGFIDYYEFVSTLHPNRDPLRRAGDADRIQDEVWGWGLSPGGAGLRRWGRALLWARLGQGSRKPQSGSPP